MRFKKLLFLILFLQLGNIFLVSNDLTGLDEDVACNENLKNYRNGYVVNPLCSTVYNHIIQLIQKLQISPLSTYEQEALDDWLSLYTQMNCYDQSSTNCTVVFNKIFQLITTLQKGPLSINQAAALDYWFILYFKMKCYDQSSNCAAVLDNIFTLISKLQNSTIGLPSYQQDALDAWTGIYELMKCAGCACTGGCTGVCS